jgi:transposase
VLIDAGYCSESNIKALYGNNIHFLTRLPSDRRLYKSLIDNHAKDLEKASNAIKCNDRTLFIQKIETNLYGSSGYAYMILDLVRKSSEVNKIFGAKEDKKLTEQDLQDGFNNAGIMILISSKSLEPEEAISTYYTRQSIEQIFGFFKSDLDSLPIRRHSDENIRGYLFLQFLALILFIQVRQKLKSKFTVEQALLVMRNLKCKKFESTLVINELTRKQKDISALTGIMVPKTLGI